MSLKKELTELLAPKGDADHAAPSKLNEVLVGPAPLSGTEVTNKLINEVARPEAFRVALTYANLYFMDNGGITNAEGLWEWLGAKKLGSVITFQELNWAMKEPKWEEATWLRGIRPKNSGLDGRMLNLINQLVSTTGGSLNQRLKRAGVTEAEYETWQHYGPFKRTLSEAAEKALANAQASVNIALTQRALSGNMEAIKYFNKFTGRFDDSAIEVVDVRALLIRVVEILTKHLSDQPDTLRAIGAELSVAAVAHGVNTTNPEG